KSTLQIRLKVSNFRGAVHFGGFSITSVRHNLKSEISIANSQPPQIASSLSYAALFYQRSYMSSFLALCHLTSRFNPELILGSPSLIYIASSLRIKHTKRISLQYKSKIQTKSSRRVKKFKEKNTAK
uniref:hypothetical protein n=1 Tax=Acinetobacter bohemicus TaxID=1435036 RepID=UPI003FA1AA0C